jgi:hypothetical protein
MTGTLWQALVRLTSSYGWDSIILMTVVLKESSLLGRMTALRGTNCFAASHFLTVRLQTTSKNLMHAMRQYHLEAPKSERYRVSAESPSHPDF